MKEKKFDENKYKQEYAKKNYKRFVADLRKKDWTEVQELKKKLKVSSNAELLKTFVKKYKEN